MRSKQSFFRLSSVGFLFMVLMANLALAMGVGPGNLPFLMAGPMMPPPGFLPGPAMAPFMPGPMTGQMMMPPQPGMPMSGHPYAYNPAMDMMPVYVASTFNWNGAQPMGGSYMPPVGLPAFTNRRAHGAFATGVGF